MFRTLTVLSLQKWALDVAPLFGAQSTQSIQNKSEQIIDKTKEILEDVLEDNNLNYDSIRDNIEVSFDDRWGIRVEADLTQIPHFKYLEKGFQPFDLKVGLLNSSKAKISKAGYRYLTVPLKQRHGDINFRTVSDRSRIESWWHPGYDGRHILDKTVDRASRMVRRELRDSFSEMLGV